MQNISTGAFCEYMWKVFHLCIKFVFVFCAQEHSCDKYGRYLFIKKKQYFCYSNFQQRNKASLFEAAKRLSVDH